MIFTMTPYDAIFDDVTIMQKSIFAEHGRVINQNEAYDVLKRYRPYKR